MTIPTGKSELRALVVDDEAISRGMVVFALLNEGFVCDVATDGEKAKVLLEERHYDLLVTDLQMPYMDGYTLALDTLGGRTPPRVIVHTAHEDPRSVKDLIVRGVDDVVSKPTDYAVFAAKARGIVTRRRSDMQSYGVGSTPASDQAAVVEEAAEVKLQESPLEDGEQNLDRSETAEAAGDANASATSAESDPSPVAAKTRRVPAPRNAPVARAQKVFKISTRPSTIMSGSGSTPDNRALAGKGEAGQRKLAFIIPVLIMTFIGVAVLMTALVAPPGIDAPRPTSAGLPQHAAVRKNKIGELGLPTGNGPTNGTRLGPIAQDMVSDQIIVLHQRQNRQLQLAGEFAGEHYLAASRAQSLAAVPALENSQLEQASPLYRQTLTAVSARVEDPSKLRQDPSEEPLATDQPPQPQPTQAPQQIPSAADREATGLQLDAFETRVGDASGLEGNAQDPQAADGGELEAEFLRDLPEIRKWLAPLLRDGHTQPTPTGHVTTAAKGPMSLTALRNCGAMSHSEQGLSNLAMAVTFGNDRETVGFAPFTGGTLGEEHRMYVVPVSRLLLKYQSLLVEKGMLAE